MTPRFTKAIVRKPCPQITDGLTSVSLGTPDYVNALKQHAAYVNALQDCGLQVIELEALPAFPDSTFVEDVALLTPACAILTIPGAPSRQGETIHIRAVLEQEFEHVETISSPGTVEAGDIMMVGDHYYIGLSDRTNKEGAAQMQTILEKHGMHASVVTLAEVLHLKTGISYLEENNLLVSGEFLTKPEFEAFNRITVKEDEAYAANSLWLNGTVLVPAGHPQTATKIKALGYPVIELEMTEFQKVDGGLSCLSLRF